jgi:hypothetical protein
MDYSLYSNVVEVIKVYDFFFIKELNMKVNLNKIKL